MEKRPLLLVQLGGFCLSLFLGVWAASQWLAHLLGYHRLLGEPLLIIQETPIYGPTLWFKTHASYYTHLPEPIDESQLFMFGGLLVGLAWIGILRRLFRSGPAPISHGSARWATRRELLETGLLHQGNDHPDGVVIGCDEKGDLLLHDGKEHVFCFAPTRSGKGVGLVVPTLLTWRGSVLVLDVKGENWSLTSGWRSKFSHALYFNPTDPKSVRFNPLLEIRKGPEEVRDVQNLAEILCDPDGTSQGSDFWTASAKSLLTGLILHVLYAEEDKSLAGVLAFLRHPEREQIDSLQLMLDTHHCDGKPHPIVAQSARSVLNMADDTRSGVIVTVERFLSLFQDPVLADVTRESDFRLRDLQYGPNPVSLYLVIPPSDLIRLRPLLRMILNQLGSALTESLDLQGEHHRLLLLLDEFPILGRLDWFESALAYIAGYDLKAYIIAQDLNQIEKAYGPNNAILGNTHVRIAFATNDERTAKRISDMLGESTGVKETESLSGKKGSLSLENKSISEVEYERALMTPGEIGQLDPDKEIVMVAGQPPIQARKVRYYLDDRFKSRSPGILQDPNKARAAGWKPELSAPTLPRTGQYPDLPASKPSPWISHTLSEGARPFTEANGVLPPPDSTPTDLDAEAIMELAGQSESRPVAAPSIPEADDEGAEATPQGMPDSDNHPSPPGPVSAPFATDTESTSTPPLSGSVSAPFATDSESTSAPSPAATDSDPPLSGSVSAPFATDSESTSAPSPAATDSDPATSVSPPSPKTTENDGLPTNEPQSDLERGEISEDASSPDGEQPLELADHFEDMM